MENPPKEPKPIINFQYFQPPRPPKEKGPDPTQYLPIYPQNPYNMQYFGMPFFGNSAPMMVPPIVKTVQVSTDGPSANHQRLAVIYEDVMPVKPFSPSSTTLGERLNMYQFIRSSIFSNVDGKDVSMNTMTEIGGGPSLLSFIKFGDLNPYNTYTLSNNVYRGLPEGYLIYRTCYPVREDFGSTTCSKDATSVNVRIYKMLEGSFAVNRRNPNLFHNYDEWREVAFYEYIRENIIKKKICPHFPTIYGYFISEKCGIDFDAIELIKDSTSNKPRQNPFIPSNNIVGCNGNMTDGSKILGSLNDQLQNVNNGLVVAPNSIGIRENLLLSPAFYQSSEQLDEIKQMNTPTIYKITRPNEKPNDPIVDYSRTENFVEANPELYAGKTLVLLTESPTYNLIGWATRTYEHRGHVRAMINRGVHTSEEWMNVLFQIMVALYTMQLHGIYINNFSLANNILIKDLTLRGAITNYWKYKIDGMDYYIPNLGYLVMIDSNFKDLLNNSATRHESTFAKHVITNTGKLGGKFLGSNCKLTDDQINSKVFRMFINSFNINIFDKDFDQSGGCRPPAEVLDMISNIYGEASVDNDKDIKKYILKYMTKFLHNRTGTYLREAEIVNIRKDDTRGFVKGQIVVHEDSFGTFKFVIHLNTTNGICKILSKTNADNEDIIEMDNIPVSSLHNYSKAEPIMQVFKSNESNLNEEDLLETYVVKQ